MRKLEQRIACLDEAKRIGDFLGVDWGQGDAIYRDFA